MKYTIGFIVFILGFSSGWAKDHNPYEMTRSEVVQLTQNGTDRQYELYIRLPEAYHEDKNKKFPVIYTTDGKWQMNTLVGTTEYIIPDAIVVGISWQTNFPHEREYASRFRDYSFMPATKRQAERSSIPRNGARDHLRFIREQVISYLESNYRVDSNNRTFFGYSMGGEFGSYTLLEKPDTFHNYIIGSPDFAQRDLDFLDRLEKQKSQEQKNVNVNIYISIGELETKRMKVVQDFTAVLKRRDQTKFKVTGLEVMKNSTHTTAFPWTVVHSITWLSGVLK